MHSWVAWSILNSCCTTITTIRLQSSLHLVKPEALSPWDTNSPLLPAPSPRQLPFYFALQGTSCKGNLTVLGFFGHWFFHLAHCPHGFIHAVAYVRTSLLRLKKFHHVDGPHIRSSIDGPFCGFRLLAAVNLDASLGPLVLILWGTYLEVGLLDLMVSRFLLSWGTAILVFHSGCTVLESTNNARGFRLCTSLLPLAL